MTDLGNLTALLALGSMAFCTQIQFRAGAVAFMLDLTFSDGYSVSQSCATLVSPAAAAKTNKKGRASDQCFLIVGVVVSVMVASVARRYAVGR